MIVGIQIKTRTRRFLKLLFSALNLVQKWVESMRKELFWSFVIKAREALEVYFKKQVK